MIDVQGVSKRFRLYRERNRSLKSSVLRGRRARYEEFWALRDVSFQIKKGETFGLIGENGSGKSTLLKCIARILRPDEGAITVDGRVSALLELGAGFHPELSGRENVYLNGSILGLNRRDMDAKFEEIVDFAGLAQFIDMPVKSYSSGMYVRLGFSIAINVNPDVLLVDEILAVGDENFQSKCNEKFAQMRASGKTLVVVSHALPVVRSLCDRVVWLEHGVIQHVGKPADIIDEYTVVAHESLDAGTHSDDESRPGKGRWGSGEVRVERFEVLDSSGSATTRIRTGDKITFRIHYCTDQVISRPVFGVGIDRIDGVHVCAPNNRDANCVPDFVEGEGYVDMTVDRLLLLPGTYDVTPAVADYQIMHIYDSRMRAFRFEVLPGTPREIDAAAVVSLDGSWEVHAR